MCVISDVWLSKKAISSKSINANFKIKLCGGRKCVYVCTTGYDGTTPSFQGKRCDGDANCFELFNKSMNSGV